MFVLLVANFHEVVEGFIPLIQPVVLFIRKNLCPASRFSYSRYAAKAFDYRKLLLSIEIVSNIVKENAAVLFGGRIFYKYTDSDWRSTARTERLATLASRSFANCACIATKMKYVKISKFVSEACAKPICGITFDPSCVADISDDACIAYSVRSPTNCSDVAVVECIFLTCCRSRGIGIPDTAI